MSTAIKIKERRQCKGVWRRSCTDMCNNIHLNSLWRFCGVRIIHNKQSRRRCHSKDERFTAADRRHSSRAMCGKIKSQRKRKRIIIIIIGSSNSIGTASVGGDHTYRFNPVIEVISIILYYVCKRKNQFMKQIRKILYTTVLY